MKLIQGGLEGKLVQTFLRWGGGLQRRKKEENKEPRETFKIQVPYKIIVCWLDPSNAICCLSITLDCHCLSENRSHLAVKGILWLQSLWLSTSRQTRNPDCYFYHNRCPLIVERVLLVGFHALSSYFCIIWFLALQHICSGWKNGLCQMAGWVFRRATYWLALPLCHLFKWPCNALLKLCLSARNQSCEGDVNVSIRLDFRSTLKGFITHWHSGAWGICSISWWWKGGKGPTTAICPAKKVRAFTRVLLRDSIPRAYKGKWCLITQKG